MKYSEQDFHRIMNTVYTHNGRIYKGFNMVEDWKRNHKIRFKTFIVMTRLNRWLINFDRIAILNKVVTVITQNGWQLRPNEIEGLDQTIQRIYNMIYMGKDL